MVTVLFTFREAVPQEQWEPVLDRLRGVAGVAAAGLVKPDASLSRLRRRGFAGLAQGADATEVVQVIDAYPEVEQVEVAPARGIAAA